MQKWHLIMVLMILTTTQNQAQSGIVDDRIVIVNVGEQSRSDIAKMLNIINEMNPKVVGIDAFFLSPKADAQADRMLMEAFASTERLIMAGKLTNGAIDTSWSNFTQGSELNYVNLTVNQDNRQVETFIPNTEVQGNNVYAFAMEVARLYDPESIKTFVNRGPTKIDYTGNVMDGTATSDNRFIAIDAQDVLERDLENSIEGKIVIFGFLGRYLGEPGVSEDRFITPLNDSPQQATPDMFGVVVHANIISQIMDGR